MTNEYNNNRELPLLPPQEPKPWHYFEQTVQRRIQHYYLSESVKEPSQYIEMIHNIQTATADNIVWIHLNTPGGVLDTGIQLVNAMKASEAHIIASLEGTVASLGTLIFLAADEFIVHDNSLMMFHNYSGGVFGKGHEQIAALEATTKLVESVMKNLYVPFMSEEEFDTIANGADLYFHAEEVRSRLENMVDILENGPNPKTKKKGAKKKTARKRVAKKEPAPVEPKSTKNTVRKT